MLKKYFVTLWTEFCSYSIVAGSCEHGNEHLVSIKGWECFDELHDWYDRGSRIRFPSGTGKFSLHHRVQKCSSAHPASYPMDTRSSFPGGKAAGA
jgi:hypothetical protein